MQQNQAETRQERNTDPAGRRVWFTGDDADYIAFDYVILLDGRVVLHSALHSDTLKLYEDFLYEVVDRHEAVDCACSMVTDAEEYLEEATGFWPNIESEQDFVGHLNQALGAGLH